MSLEQKYLAWASFYSHWNGNACFHSKMVAACVKLLTVAEIRELRQLKRRYTEFTSLKGWWHSLSSAAHCGQAWHCSGTESPRRLTLWYKSPSAVSVPFLLELPFHVLNINKTNVQINISLYATSCTMGYNNYNSGIGDYWEHDSRLLMWLVSTKAQNP